MFCKQCVDVIICRLIYVCNCDNKPKLDNNRSPNPPPLPPLPLLAAVVKEPVRERTIYDTAKIKRTNVAINNVSVDPNKHVPWSEQVKKKIPILVKIWRYRY